MVGWALFPEDHVSVSGTPKEYRSSEHATQHFCADCGTGLFYRNSTVFPGMVDVQTATLEDQAAFPPAVHVQWAEAAIWMEVAHELPRFERYPES
jgi:hypothetical protein